MDLISSQLFLWKEDPSHVRVFTRFVKNPWLLALVTVLHTLQILTICVLDFLDEHAEL